jgi:hypothetical protein
MILVSSKGDLRLWIRIFDIYSLVVVYQVHPVLHTKMSSGTEPDANGRAYKHGFSFGGAEHARR